MLGVFGLSKRTTEDDLRREFGKYGPLQKVVVVMDRRVPLYLNNTIEYSLYTWYMYDLPR